MKMMRTLSLVVFLMFSFRASAQKLVDINLKASGNNAYIRFVTFIIDGTELSVNAKGSIRLYPSQQTNLIYYDNFDGAHRTGKLKLIGETAIDYYDQFDGEKANIGKLKSVGPIKIIYYDKFSGQDNIGLLKAVGATTFTYYDKFDGHDNLGKLKTIGNIQLTYYDRFDDAAVRGKLKSIGSTTITYYDKFDGENAGKIKSINGNTPFLSIDAR